jgi:hypothetical protein
MLGWKRTFANDKDYEVKMSRTGFLANKIRARTSKSTTLAPHTRLYQYVRRGLWSAQMLLEGSWKHEDCWHLFFRK